MKSRRRRWREFWATGAATLALAAAAVLSGWWSVEADWPLGYVVIGAGGVDGYIGSRGQGAWGLRCGSLDPPYWRLWGFAGSLRPSGVAFRTALAPWAAVAGACCAWLWLRARAAEAALAGNRVVGVLMEQEPQRQPAAVRVGRPALPRGGDDPRASGRTGADAGPR